MLEKYFEFQRYTNINAAKNSRIIGLTDHVVYAIFRDANGFYCIAQMKDLVSSAFKDSAMKIYKLTGFQMIAYRQLDGNWQPVDIEYPFLSLWPPAIIEKQNELSAFLLPYERFIFHT